VTRVRTGSIWRWGSQAQLNGETDRRIAVSILVQQKNQALKDSDREKKSIASRDISSKTLNNDKEGDIPKNLPGSRECGGIGWLHWYVRTGRRPRELRRGTTPARSDEEEEVVG